MPATVFFFSSRRRHTRLTCDWSSDVCSSDLTLEFAKERTAFGRPIGRFQAIRHKFADMATKIEAGGAPRRPPAPRRPRRQEPPRRAARGEHHTPPHAAGGGGGGGADHRHAGGPRE